MAYFVANHITVTGPSLVCTSNSTFTLHNRPSGTTVNWEKSNNLSYVSGQGTNSYTVKAVSSSTHGWGWVEATIDCDCGDVTFREDFWVGYPEIGDLVFTNGIGEEEFLCSNQEGNLVEFTSGVYNYFDIWLWNEYGTQVLYKFKTYTTEGSLDFSWISPGYYLVEVRGINDCGTGEWSGSEVEYIDCSFMEEEENMYYLEFAPNPATDEITMELKTDNIDTYTEGDKWEAEIFNQQMLLMHKTTRLKDKTYTINVSGWKEGIYYVRVRVKDKLVSGKFIVVR